MQQQFAIINQPMNFAPKTINTMSYKVKAFESVRLIINYTKGNLNAIADVIHEYIKEGLPFNTSLQQLEKTVNDKERKYIEETVKSVMKREAIELGKVNTEIEIDNIFAPQEVIEQKKRKALGDKMKMVKSHIEKKRLESMNLKDVASTNIKNIVANYASKGVADKIYDPYSYLSEE